LPRPGPTALALLGARPDRRAPHPRDRQVSWAPWGLFSRIPVIESVIPERFIVFVYLSLGVVLAVVVDSARSWALGADWSARSGARWFGMLAGLAVAVAALAQMAVLFAPELPYTVGRFAFQRGTRRWHQGSRKVRCSSGSRRPRQDTRTSWPGRRSIACTIRSLPEGDPKGRPPTPHNAQRIRGTGIAFIRPLSGAAGHARKSRGGAPGHRRLGCDSDRVPLDAVQPGLVAPTTRATRWRSSPLPPVIFPPSPIRHGCST